MASSSSKPCVRRCLTQVRLSAGMAGSMQLLEEIRLLEARVAQVARELAVTARLSPACTLLASVPGIGLLIAIAMVAATSGNVSHFKAPLAVELIDSWPAGVLPLRCATPIALAATRHGSAACSVWRRGDADSLSARDACDPTADAGHTIAGASLCQTQSIRSLPLCGSPHTRGSATALDALHGSAAPL